MSLAYENEYRRKEIDCLERIAVAVERIAYHIGKRERGKEEVVIRTPDPILAPYFRRKSEGCRLGLPHVAIRDKRKAKAKGKRKSSTIKYRKVKV